LIRAGDGYRGGVTVPISSDAPVRVRFAPSPTGAMHLGSALVAVANAAIVRATGGTLLLRIDDTDQARSKREDTLELLRLLRWLGIEWDEGPVYQHTRGTEYRKALDELLEREQAYPCFCGDARLAKLRADQVAAGLPPRYDGRCRALTPDEVQAALEEDAPHTIRFAVPEGRDVEIDDLVHGKVVVPSGAFGDPVIVRSDATAGYLLASVVDDLAFEITHVIRGEDHLTNTARQVLLMEALDAPQLPTFAHLPLLRDAEGRKLSKRDPLGTLDEVADEGFLPTTVRRYLAELLGQGPVDLLADDEPAREFFIDRIPTGAPKVDRARLQSLGREDMALLDVGTLLEGSGIPPSEVNEQLVLELAAAAPSRVALRGELRLVFDGPGAGDLPLVYAFVAPEPATLAAQDVALDLAVEELRAELAPGLGAGSDTEWSAPFVARLREAGAARGMGARELLQPLRVALTGITDGPGLELILTAIGARESLRRVHLARMILDELRGEEAVVG
jgi:glutamyl-tRNA synthetase